MKKLSSRIEENDRQYPKHLNWKCLDKFDKMKSQKMFYLGKMDLSYLQRDKLSKLFNNINLKWKPKLEELVKSWTSEEQSHLDISGGNYTFFFVLPNIINYIKTNYPHLSLKLSLFENAAENISFRPISDIILTSFSVTGFKNQSQLNETNYKMMRKSYQDFVTLGASKEAVKEFGSKEKVLMKHDVLFDRIYSSSQSNIKIDRRYSIAPKGRELVTPRVVVDQYFLKYALMCNSVGISHVHKSITHNKSIVILTRDVIAKYIRFCIVKNTVNKKYNPIARKLIKLFNSGGIK